MTSSTDATQQSSSAVSAASQYCNDRDESEVREQIIDITQNLLDAIVSCDWDKYSELCHSSLTCFEPEARGHLVQGLSFHKYYFDFFGSSSAAVAASAGTTTTSPSAAGTNVTLSSPHVRLLGNKAAVICYVRLNQSVDGTTQMPVTSCVEETRVWEVIEGRWMNVHFHRSVPS
eukprot:CAMPEP_0172488760 /NCGR_PEP_ID=MMETSP1066-20121228/18482_1 /TAXON_ID=671091 /ORGANISM="Coscinodiscus wailesii, Strain CCMP2513" /LENGTH=173 /DNA_ID=CAMNT_0013256207 /DNA_START=75 /DNA_END=599 /DNA_ORIENTATION=-